MFRLYIWNSTEIHTTPARKHTHTITTKFYMNLTMTLWQMQNLSNTELIGKYHTLKIYRRWIFEDTHPVCFHRFCLNFTLFVAHYRPQCYRLGWSAIIRNMKNIVWMSTTNVCFWPKMCPLGDLTLTSLMHNGRRASRQNWVEMVQTHNYCYQRIIITVEWKSPGYWSNSIHIILKSHNAPVPYPIMHHSEQKCAYFCSE